MARCPRGRTPAQISVKRGIVDLSQLKDILADRKRIPPGVGCMGALRDVVNMHEFTFRDFWISLHNLQWRARKLLAVSLFSQAVGCEFTWLGLGKARLCSRHCMFRASKHCCLRVNVVVLM